VGRITRGKDGGGGLLKKKKREVVQFRLLCNGKKEKTTTENTPSRGVGYDEETVKQGYQKEGRGNGTKAVSCEGKCLSGKDERGGRDRRNVELIEGRTVFLGRSGGSSLGGEKRDRKGGGREDEKGERGGWGGEEREFTASCHGEGRRLWGKCWRYKSLLRNFKEKEPDWGEVAEVLGLIILEEVSRGKGGLQGETFGGRRGGGIPGPRGRRGESFKKNKGEENIYIQPTSWRKKRRSPPKKIGRSVYQGGKTRKRAEKDSLEGHKCGMCRPPEEAEKARERSLPPGIHTTQVGTRGKNTPSQKQSLRVRNTKREAPRTADQEKPGPVERNPPSRGREQNRRKATKPQA